MATWSLKVQFQKYIMGGVSLITLNTYLSINELFDNNTL